MKRPIRLRIFTGLLAAWIFLPGLLSAQGAGDERLIREIEDTLIAPCCWNQPISQHYSEVSEQMRQEVRAMVAAGRTKREILDHFVARYGERILATPRARGINALAYLLPWAALIAGGGYLLVLLRKRRQAALAAPAAPPPPADARYDAVIEKELKELDT